MKKKLTLALLTFVIMCISTSCARKSNGATPHRRDRNCGCEYLQAPGSSDSVFACRGVSHAPEQGIGNRK